MSVAAISLSPLYAERLHILRSTRVGATLVIASLAIGGASLSGLDSALPPKDELFCGLFAALLLGSFMILAGSGDDDEDNGEPDRERDGDPPWWPEFEAGFRQYARRPRRPLTRV